MRVPWSAFPKADKATVFPSRSPLVISRRLEAIRNLFRSTRGSPSSLLQKSIRRGAADLATRAALTLFRLRRAAIWRRFTVIAFEDVGAASVDALVRAVAAGTDPRSRAGVGGDQRVVAHIARLLAEAPKDRSADHLICCARSLGAARITSSDL